MADGSATVTLMESNTKTITLIDATRKTCTKGDTLAWTDGLGRQCRGTITKKFREGFYVDIWQRGTSPIVRVAGRPVPFETQWFYWAKVKIQKQLLGVMEAAR